MLTNFYIVSDLHLSERHPETTLLFACFLKDVTALNHTLYILGDFFNYWIGDDDLSKFNRSVIALLKDAVENGLKIYLMHGNRDFLINQQFANKSGVILLPDPSLIYDEQKHILLMHGDLLCTDDKSYQLFRKIVRNTITKSLYLMMPLALRKKIVQIIRQRCHQKTKKVKIVDVTTTGIKRYIKECKVLIHGHTHLFNQHRCENYSRYVLGSWGETGSFIKIHNNIISLNKYKGSGFKT